MIDDTESLWTIIESYFKNSHLEMLVRHQLESYNNFVNFQITKTIEMFNPIHIRASEEYNFLEIFITFENFHLYRPQIHENNGSVKILFPHEARMRNFTYASAMISDINVKYIIHDVDPEAEAATKVFYKSFPKIHIGKLPIMVKSSICVLNQYKHISPIHTDECKYDTGGYFIIKGSEKTVLGQERSPYNRVLCYNIAKNDPKHLWKAEIKSIPDFKCISPKQITMYISSKDNGFGFPLSLQMPRVKEPIPLFIVFRALGILSDREICEYILLDLSQNDVLLDHLTASIIDADKYLTYEDALGYLVTRVGFAAQPTTEGAAKKAQFTMDVLKNDLFPHCRTIEQKTYFLGYMANRLLQASVGYIKADDRDSYVNKRVDLTGVSLNNLFRNDVNTLVKDIESQIKKEIKSGSWRSKDDFTNIINQTNIYKIVKSTTIENGFKRALSTGDFGIKHGSSNKVGVAQVLNRLTYIAGLSHLRRISTPSNDKSGKLIPPRKLHPTSWGYICPAESPEGASVGMVKNLSYMTHVTIYSDSSSLYDYILPNIESIDSSSSSCPNVLYNKVKVFINGTWVGITLHPQALYEQLKDMKYKGIINVYTSIVFDYRMQEIRVCNDGGRLTRPLLRVKNNAVLITPEMVEQLKSGDLIWDDLIVACRLSDAVIEYIDPEEQNGCVIATTLNDLHKGEKQYTHCEIHPSTLFGVVASCIPYPDHNQSPRNTYQCAQAKQAMGIYATNFHARMDKTGYILSYPTRPLVDTRLMSMIKLHEIPSGCNITVAIMTHTGYNQEDSLLVNKGSIDRGLLQVTLTHTEKDEDKQNTNGDEVIRCRPDSVRTKGMRITNYGKLDSKGMVSENTFIEDRDIIIGKVTPIKEYRNDPTKIIKFQDGSKMYRTVDETYVDKNYLGRNGDGYTFAKVRLRTLRKPVIGDKFSSRHGQKGTVGNIIPEEDMPFTRNGDRPDIIINPHAIPSRMTIGQLLETQVGKVLIQLGLFGDGTSFGDTNVSDISRLLLEVGYEAHGNELLYSGTTGEQIECSVFMGPVFYQRLKHMVNDKQHSRASGPMVNLTRQPAEGRSRGGGLRFGEMERDCMVSHGAARFTRGRLYDASDKYSVCVCKKCGLIAAYNDVKNIHLCATCNNRTDFAHVEIPYACKLLFQELTTMNVVPRLMVK